MPLPDEAQAAVLEQRSARGTTTASVSVAGIRAVTECLRVTEAVHKAELVDQFTDRLQDLDDSRAIPEVLEDLVEQVFHLAKRDVERRLPIDILLDLIPRIVRSQQGAAHNTGSEA